MDKEKAIDDLKQFFGLPPHNVPSNINWGDGYFANAIEKEYGMNWGDLAKLLGIENPTGYYG